MLDKFNVGDRCVFGISGGMISYGNVTQVDSSGEKLKIRADDGRIYEGLASHVMNLERKKK